MKITFDEKDESFEIIPEGNETLEHIACAVIMSVYNRGQVYGLGNMRAYGTELTKEMALRMLNGEDISHDYCGESPNKKNYVYMDYVFGRCCKTIVKIEEGKVKGRIGEGNTKRVLAGVEQLIKEL